MIFNLTSFFTHTQAAPKKSTTSKTGRGAATKRQREDSVDNLSDHESDNGVEINPPSDDESEDENDDIEWAIDHIVSGPNSDGQYEIRWEGFDGLSNTWEPEGNLPRDLISEYLLRND